MSGLQQLFHRLSAVSDADRVEEFFRLLDDPQVKE
jgi:hypothetical protein